MSAMTRAQELTRSQVALTCTACAVLAIWSVDAAAQEFDPRTPLENRARPEFSVRPITVGAFEIRPRVDVSIEYVDNLFASETFDVNDIAVSVRPGVTVLDQRADRSISVNLSTGFQTFLNDNSEDLFQIFGQAKARFGLGSSTRPYIGATFRLNDANQFEFSGESNVAQPLLTTSYGGNLGLEQDIGPFTVEGEARFNRFYYDGLIFSGSTSFDGALRNYAYYEGRGRVSFAARSDRRVYVEGRYGRFDYEGMDRPVVPGVPEFFLADRSGDTHTVVGGVQVRVTSVLSLDANVGYTRLSFENPALDPISGLSAEANLYYAPTRLTRFQLQATRSIDQSINPLTSSSLRTGFALVAEHELRRNVLLRSEARYVDYNSRETNLLGDEYQFSGSLVYFLSPALLLKLRGEYFSRSGFASGDQQRGLLSIGYRF